MAEIIIKTDDKFLEVAKAEGMEERYELIRCKDCKHWEQSHYDPRKHVCYWARYYKHENDFCSKAERKDK